MQRNQLMNMIYVFESGLVTKRRIKIIKVVGVSFQAFRFTRQAKRTFTINNVLVVVPVLHKEREVI
ncbi:transcriptional regulator [Lysinibacillus sp. NPDC048646]|uniref:transcriptional regulator n=1 Tax=Lysinibacillus sp. NPDC048646 TaxID=3390574 RepID=UPI003CFE4915